MKFYDEPFDALIKSRFDVVARSLDGSAEAASADKFATDLNALSAMIRKRRVHEALAYVDHIVNYGDTSSRAFAALGAVLADQMGSRAHLERYLKVSNEQGLFPDDFARWNASRPEALREEAVALEAEAANDPSLYLAAIDTYGDAGDVKSVVRVYDEIRRRGLSEDELAADYERNVSHEADLARKRLETIDRNLSSSDPYKRALGFEALGRVDEMQEALMEARREQLDSLLNNREPRLDAYSATFELLVRNGKGLEALDMANANVVGLRRTALSVASPAEAERGGPSDAVSERLIAAAASLQMCVAEYFLQCGDKERALNAASGVAALGRGSDSTLLEIRAAALTDPSGAMRKARALEPVDTRSNALLDLGTYFEKAGDHNRAMACFKDVPAKDATYQARLITLADEVVQAADSVRKGGREVTQRDVSSRAASLYAYAAIGDDVSQNPALSAALFEKAAHLYCDANDVERAKRAHLLGLDAAIAEVNLSAVPVQEKSTLLMEVVAKRTYEFADRVTLTVGGPESSDAAAEALVRAGHITAEREMFERARPLYINAGRPDMADGVGRLLESTYTSQQPAGGTPADSPRRLQARLAADRTSRGRGRGNSNGTER